MTQADEYVRQLAGLAEAGRLRRLSPRDGIDFASNDYLGLAGDPLIAAAVAGAIAAGVPVGSGGSRLLRGNAPEHEALEAKAAAFFGTEAALFFSSGFAANLALYSTLPQKGDLVVADALIHASAHDGLRRTRANHVFAAHNDVQSFADAIGEWRKAGGTGRVWIAFETLYSMDGDRAPVDELAALAEAHDAWLLIDEAHSTGVHGPGGRGLAAFAEGHGNVVVLHTCGKALGVEGALVTASRPVIDFLVNRARSFIFSTAPSPLMAVAASAALDRVASGDALRARLADLIAFAGDAICVRLGLGRPQSQIVPIILGGEERTMAAAKALQCAGFDVRGIRPPTVPDGTSRLRISLTLNVDRAEIAALSDELAELL